MSMKTNAARNQTRQTGEAPGPPRRPSETQPDSRRCQGDPAAEHHRDGDRPTALQLCREAVRKNPQNAAAHRDLANYLYAEMGEAAEAFLHYRHALALEPRDVETLLICGNLCVVEHRFEEAREFYGKALDIEPWNLDAATCMEQLDAIEGEGNGDQGANAHYEAIGAGDPSRNASQMMAKLKELVEKYPDFAPAHNDLGVLHYHRGLKSEAREYYEAAVRLQPDNIVFKKNLADFYSIEEGRIREALDIYHQVLSAEPNDVETLMVAGHICRALELPDDARVFYERVTEIEPWNSEAGRLLEHLG
jgi:tetratricopeptide (TPR) repeat protein